MDKVVQVGIVVRDIEKTRDRYCEAFERQAPPIIGTSGHREAQTEFRGAPSDARAKLCFFDFGSLQIELIEPDANPHSTWREHLDRHGESVHHIAFVVKGMSENLAALAAKGLPLVQKGEYTGGRYAYVESNDALGVALELLEND